MVSSRWSETERQEFMECRSCCAAFLVQPLLAPHNSDLGFADRVVSLATEVCGVPPTLGTVDYQMELL